MKAYIDGGVAILEMTASELRTLYIALDHECGHHSHMAALCEESAAGHERMAKTAKRKVAALRTAGELREKATGHKALMRDAGDLRRVLHPLTTSPDVK